MTARQLEKWLAWEILGKKIPRRPPTQVSALHNTKPARNWRYKLWIRSLPSAVSGLQPCEAAHTGTDGGMRQKASDYSCIPLTPTEHLEYHLIGKLDFASKYNLDIPALVKRLNHCWFNQWKIGANE